MQEHRSEQWRSSAARGLALGLAGGLVVCGGPGAHAQGQKPDTYFAETAVPAKRQGTVAVGTVKWVCEGRKCSVMAAWPSPSVRDCQALQQQVGQITAFASGARRLTSEEIKACNVAKTAEAPPRPTTPVKPSSGQPTLPVKPTTPVAPSPQQQATPAARGTARTQPLVFTGTGAALLNRTTVTIRTSTATLSFTGTGSFPTRTAIAPVSVRASGLSYSGTGAF